MTEIEIVKDLIQKRILFLEESKKELIPDYKVATIREKEVIACQNMLYGMEIQFLKSLQSHLI